MNDQERVRVTELEAKYDAFKPKLDQLRQSLEAFKESYQDYIELREFYGSQEWFDLREKPHHDLKSGILSEDQLYDFVVDHGDLLADFLDLSAEMYRNI